MSLQFYIGASGTGKSTTVYQDILKRAKEEPFRRFFIIVPDQFTMQTQKVLCHMSENGGIMNVEVLSFGRLSHRIFEELGFQGLVKLDDTGKNLIIRKVAADHEKELSVVSANIKKVGYIAEIKSMISEFAQYGIEPDDVSAICEKTEGKGYLSAKLHDLHIIYREYQNYIRDKYITVEENIDILVRNIHRSKIMNDSVVVFDGFTGFTPIQNRLLQEIMIYSKQVIVTLLADSKEELVKEDLTQGMFYLTGKAYQKLCALASQNGIARDEDVVLVSGAKSRFSENRALAHLEKNIFRIKKEKPVNVSGSVQISHCMNPKAEVDWVCLTIRRLIREKGYCYRDFAVITGDLGSYGHILKESFAEQEIPLFLDQNTSLLFHPLMVFLLALARVLTANFSYEAVMELLRVGYLDLTDDEIDLFEQYIREKGIRGKKKYTNPFETEGAHLEIAEKVREKLLSAVKPLLSAKKDTRSYVKALYDICVTLEIEAKLREMAQGFSDAENFVKAKEYEQVYGAVIGLFDQIYALLDEKMSLADFSDILKAGFAELKVGSIPQTVDQVVAGDLERTRLKPIKVLFIVGANDGIIPGNGATGGLLSDLERTFLQDLGVELAPTKRQKGFEERLYLYMNMTQPTEILVISYSEVDLGGKQIRPSYLVRMVKALFSDLAIDIIDDDKMLAMVESRESGMKLFTKLLREYAAGILIPDKEDWDTLFELAKIFEGDDTFSKILSAAFYKYEANPLPKEIAEKLYGEILNTSVSRLEKFAACAYAHFLKYGLQLKEEYDFSFETVDLGNLYHDTLYDFGGYLLENGYNWFHYPEQDVSAFVEEKVESFAKGYRDELLYDTARNRALKNRTKDILCTSIKSLTYQLRKGVFEPVCYEMPFSYETNPKLYGKIDRLDLAKDDEHIYVKIMDYKSGDHSFDPARLLYGLDLQLAVYMNAAVASQKKKAKGKKVVPSAIFYYQMIDPMVESSSTESLEERERKIQKELCVQGLILEDDAVLSNLDSDRTEESTVIPVKYKKDGSVTAASQTATKEQFELISRFADYKIKQIGEEIQNGNISIEPTVSGSNKSACGYCAYKNVCGFEKKISGFSEKKIQISKENAFLEMEKEMAEDGIHERPAEGHINQKS